MLLAPHRPYVMGTIDHPGTLVLNPDGLDTTGWTDASAPGELHAAREHTVTVPGLLPQVVQIARAEPTAGGLQRAIQFYSGGSGETFLLGNVAAQPWIDKMRADGSRLTMTKFVAPGWFENEDTAIRPGPAVCAGRPSTVTRYLWAQFAVGDVLHGVGVSGGASTLGYLFSFYGLDDLFDAKVPVAGPPHADMHSACTQVPGLAADHDEAVKFDRAYLAIPLETACDLNQPQVRGGAWAFDSVLAGNLGWADARTLYSFGELDLTPASPQGKLVLAKQPVARATFPPNEGHGGITKPLSQMGIYDFIKGAPIIRQAVLEQSAITTGLVLPFSQGPPKVSSLLLAPHRCAEVAHVPTGWQVAESVAVMSGPSVVFMLQMLWRIADGTETGVTLSSESGASGRQAGELYEVPLPPGFSSWVLDSHVSAAPVGNVTSCPIGPTGVPAAAKAFCVAAVASGSVAFAQSWTNGFAAFGKTSRLSTAAKALTAAAAQSTAETWDVPDQAVGALCVWRPV